MTFQIKRSDLPCGEQEFAQRVLDHAQALAEYARHLVGVEQDAANPDLKPEERRIAFPPPMAHPLVEKSVDGYEIVGPSLAERKAALTADVRQREMSLIAEVMPTAKQRHWQFREHDIAVKSQKHLAESKIILDDSDQRFLDEMTARHEAVAAIQRWAAKLEHDIDDLTEETIATFRLTPFNG